MGIECHITDSVDNTKTDLLLIDVQHYFSDMHTQKSIPQTLSIVGLIAHGSPTEIERAIAMVAMAVVGGFSYGAQAFSATSQNASRARKFEDAAQAKTCGYSGSDRGNGQAPDLRVTSLRITSQLFYAAKCACLAGMH
jgi:hypothetical protein